MDTDHFDSVDDIFESAVNLTQIDESFKEGCNDGLISGKEEGCEVDLKHGFEIGEALGFNRGCIGVWTSAIRVNPNCFFLWVQEKIKTMDGFLQKYPWLNPESESIIEILDSLRLNLKSISATLKAKLEYNGHPKAMDANDY